LLEKKLLLGLPNRYSVVKLARPSLYRHVDEVGRAGRNRLSLLELGFVLLSLIFLFQYIPVKQLPVHFLLLENPQVVLLNKLHKHKVLLRLPVRLRVRELQFLQKGLYPLIVVVVVLLL